MLEFVAGTARDAGLERLPRDRSTSVGVRADGLSTSTAYLGGTSTCCRVSNEHDRGDRGRDQGRDACGDQLRTDTLRLTLASLRAAEKELGRFAQGGRGAAGAPSRAEAARRGGRRLPFGRARRSGREGGGELEVTEEFIPEPLEEEEIEADRRRRHRRDRSTSLRDLGRVMADVMPQVAGARRRFQRSASSCARSSHSVVPSSLVHPGLLRVLAARPPGGGDSGRRRN